MEQLFKSRICNIVILGVFFLGINAQIVFPDDAILVENSPCKLNDLLWGVCTRSSLCPTIKLEMSMNKICSFDGNEAIICCVRASELACNGYAIKDGKLKRARSDGFFVGGFRAKPREYPHMVAIGWTEESGVSWRCGGSLITYMYLITAAHCTATKGISPDIVRAGVTNLAEENPDFVPVDYNITEIIVHPDYKPSAVYHDIALVKIAMQALLYFSPVKSICLWANDVPPNPELLAMGFGTTSFGGPQSNELIVGSLKYIEQNECVAAFALTKDERLSNGVIEGQMCAKDPDGTKDTCQGDSGGPLQVSNNSSGFTIPYIVGITSFGEGCLGSTPGVYTRVFSYLDWIEKIVWPYFK